MSRIAAVLVTHDSQAWLDATLASIESQSRVPDEVVVVDDGSRDDTSRILAAHGIVPIPAATTAADTVTRIAANFVQGVRACATADAVILGDHDDVWHPDRVARHWSVFEMWPAALMDAGDGRLVDASGEPTGGTLRTTFPVSADWETLAPADRMRYALRHSIATGGASAIRPAGFADLSVPAGWLHDRWWSLVATACDAMVVTRDTVIDYRVQEDQQVGLDTAAQATGGMGRLTSLVRQASRSSAKQRDLRTRLRPLAIDSDVASAIRIRNVL